MPIYITEGEGEMLRAFALLFIERKVKEKSEKYETILIDRWFPLREITTSVIIGSFSITDTANRRRWLLSSQARLIAGKWCTPTDLSRAYIDYKYPQPLRMNHRQYVEFHDNPRYTPLLAVPTIFENGAYVDIKSAYWNILKIFGWDADYMPNYFIGVKSDVSDFPFPEDKMARNTLVSVGSTNDMRIWTGEKLIFVKKGNRHANIIIWSLICDILHGVAYDAVQAGAVYVYTDGYICEDSRVGAVLEAISAWGLEGRVKASGFTEVRGAGAYHVGTVYSKPFELNRHRTISRVTLNPFHEWLRKKCFSWSKRRKTANFLDKLD